MAPSQRRSASALASALLLLALARPAASQGGCTPTTVTAPDIRTECVALRTIYGFLGRQPSSWAGAIAAGSSYCSYPGVTCATVSGENRVVGLYLDNNGLQGLIPPYIGNLLLLNEINLSNNNFTGQIPLSLGRLTSLTNLDLRYNTLQGTVPSALGLCTALQTVYLDNNQIGGTVPATLSLLPALTTFSAPYNQLGGPLPYTLGQSTSLATLVLNNNLIAGTIPPAIGNMSQLSFLDLSSNQLTGSVPMTFGMPTNSLGTLNLYNNSLTSFDPGWPCSFAVGLQCGLNSFAGSCVKQCLTPTFGACGVTACAAPSCTATGVTGTDNATDCAAVRALYAAFNNAPSSWTGGMNRGLSYCDWDANTLQCDTYGRVTALLLSGLGLTGTIPSVIGSLAMLTQIDLSNNQLNGTIPSSFSVLTNLKQLSLTNNLLTGTIPPEFGSFVALTNLDLSVNQLNGSIPATIGLSSKLLTLDLSDNLLTGVLTSAIMNMKKLTTLDVSNNQLSGTVPAALGNLTVLAAGSIDISGNRFTGWGRNFSCTWAPVSLSCSGNNFGCYADPSWCLITSNVVTGCGVGVCSPPPTQLSGCSYLGATAPDDANECTAMRAAFVAFNQRPASWLTGYYTGASYCAWDPNTIACDSAGHITSLTFNGNLDIGGTIPAQLRWLSRLKTLIITNNNITGTFPQAIFARCRNLSYVAVHDNLGLTGTVPETLGALRNLTHLELQNQYLYGTIPSGLGAALNITYIDMSSNLISGTIPPSFGNFRQLTTLMLYSNYISGQFPDQAMNGMWALQYLDVSDNYLNGTIPFSGNSTNLYHMDWSFNNLTGTIAPYTVGNYSAVQYWDLSYNLLTGTLPAALAALPSLGTFQVGNNSLTAFDPGFPCSFQVSPDTFGCSNNNWQAPTCAKACVSTWATPNCGVPLCPPPGCSVNGATGSTNAGDCAALIGLFQAFGNTPGGWQGGINAGTDYCSWDGSIVCDNYGRVIQLQLSGAGLRGSISSLIGSLPMLTQIDLSNNGITGGLPQEIGNLPNLQSLVISGNQISGTIPPSLNQLTALTYMDISNNAFNGTLINLASLKNLTYFDASFNQLSHGFPVMFGTMKKIQTIKVTNNMITGNIPNAIQGAKTLQVLQVDNNQMSGTLTAGLAKLPLLNTLTITGNKFRTWDLNFNCSWPGPSATFACSGNTFSCWPSTFCPALLTTIQALDGSCAVACPPPPGPPPVGRRMMAVAE